MRIAVIGGGPGGLYLSALAKRLDPRADHDIAVVAVGAISSYDDANSILLAGRADLTAIGRAHLYEPQWTRHAAAEQGYTGPGAQWPNQFPAGNRKPPTGRTDGPPPRVELIRSPTTTRACAALGVPG